MAATAPFPPTPPPSNNKRQKVVHDTLFPTFYLPKTAVAQILKYLDIATRVKATRCNKSWRNEIYGDHDHPHQDLWKVIDFDDDLNNDRVRCRTNNGGQTSPPTKNGERETKEKMMTTKECPSPQEDKKINKKKPAARISDEQLGALLRNCRAVERCEVLKLNGCFNIKGNGLEPLRGSRVLREIDLRLVVPPKRGQQASPDIILGKRTDSSTHPPPKVDPSLVIPILSSMPPLAPRAVVVPTTTSLTCAPCTSSPNAGLSLIKFDIVDDTTTHYYSRFANEAGDFLYEFHQALRRQAEQNNPSHWCGYCQGNVLDGKSEDCKQWIMGTSYCEACKQFSCGNGPCPSPWNCVDCLVQCCQPMGPGSSCMGQDQNQDHQQKQLQHKVIYMCKSCDRLQCEDCFEGLLCANDDCCNEYCNSNDCLSQLFSCDICHSGDKEFKFYCPDCIADHERYCPGRKKTTTTTKKSQAT